MRNIESILRAVCQARTRDYGVRSGLERKKGGDGGERWGIKPPQIFISISLLPTFHVIPGIIMLSPFVIATPASEYLPFRGQRGKLFSHFLKCCRVFLGFFRTRNFDQSTTPSGHVWTVQYTRMVCKYLGKKVCWGVTSALEIQGFRACLVIHWS